MRALLISTALLFVTTGVAFAEESALDRCLFCHDPGNEMRLMGKGTDFLVAKMEAIRAGEIKHVAGLADLSDEQIATLAAALNSGEIPEGADIPAL